jgi:broad specificity phosphatase PhoE
MKPKRIILIRHGESESNIDKTFYSQKPDYTSQLTLKGIEQAEDAGRRLKLLIGEESVFFYVSPFWRCPCNPRNDDQIIFNAMVSLDR